MPSAPCGKSSFHWPGERQVQNWLGKRKAKQDGTELDEAAVVDAAVRRGIAFLTRTSTPFLAVQT
jgi:hypothetical protein